jgi:hypothetical protein
MYLSFWGAGGYPMMNFPTITDIIFGSVNWDASFGNFPILCQGFHFILLKPSGNFTYDQV